MVDVNELQQAAEEQNRKAKLVERAEQDIKEADLPPIEGSERYKVFVAPNDYANHQFLVKGGEVVYAPVTAATPTGTRPAIGREGDKWAVFRNGVCVTDDPEVIAWCESHPEVCKPINDPRVRAWVALRNAKTPTASSDPTLPPDVDVDALFAEGGDLSRFAHVVQPHAGDIIDVAQKEAEVAIQRETEGEPAPRR